GVTGSGTRRMSLEGDGGASALQGLLGLVGGVLVDLLQDRLRRAVDQVLGLLQAQGGQRTDLLDDLDLLVTSSLEDDVELALLLSSSGGLAAATGRSSTGNGDGGRGGDVEGLLELLHELGELDQGHLLEALQELLGAQLRHGGVPSLWCREWRDVVVAATSRSARLSCRRHPRRRRWWPPPRRPEPPRTQTARRSPRHPGGLPARPS